MSPTIDTTKEGGNSTERTREERGDVHFTEDDDSRWREATAWMDHPQDQGSAVVDAVSNIVWICPEDREFLQTIAVNRYLPKIRAGMPDQTVDPHGTHEANVCGVFTEGALRIWLGDTDGVRSVYHRPDALGGDRGVDGIFPWAPVRYDVKGSKHASADLWIPTLARATAAHVFVLGTVPLGFCVRDGYVCFRGWIPTKEFVRRCRQGRPHEKWERDVYFMRQRDLFAMAQLETWCKSTRVH